MNNHQAKIQEAEYETPYHHLVCFAPRRVYDFLSWGMDYYGYVKAAMDLLPPEGLARVAEVGCGDGKITLELARLHPGVQFEGYDISERAILYAKAFGYDQPNLKFFAADFRTAEGEYDAIVCVETLEHISDEEISDFVSVLRSKTKKYLIVSVPTVNVKLNPKHYRHYDLSLLEKQLVGFRLVSSVFIGIDNWLSRLLTRCLSNRFFLTRTLHLTDRVFDLYAKFCTKATSKNGWHLVAKFEIAD